MILPMMYERGKIERDRYCNGRKMSILDIGPVIFADIDTQIDWFQNKHLLSLQPNCSACGQNMIIQVRTDIQDKRR